MDTIRGHFDLAGAGDCRRTWQAGARAARFLTRILTQRFAWVPFALSFLYATALQVWTHQANFSQWDGLQLSGWATLVVGLIAAQRVPCRLRQTLARLCDRGVLVAPEGDLRPVHEELEAHSQGWAVKTGSVAAASVLVAFVVAYPMDPQRFGLLLPFEMLGGFIAGFHLGRLASYGRLGTVLRHTGCQVRPRPGHIDKAAGLKPIGDFFFFQAMIAGIPAAFLAVWWVLIPLKGARYANWRRPYLGLLVIAIALEMLAFLVPMLTFHREMGERKQEFLREADKLSIEIDELATMPSAKDQLTASKERYRAIEAMPTWPIDNRTRRRFRVNNLALVLPVLAQALGHSALGHQIADILKNLM